MRAATVVGIVLLCGIAQGAEPKTVTNSVGMELIEMPAGTFTMGSPATGEAVQVTLTKPFWLATTEVTQGQFKKVMGTEPWKGQGNVQAHKDCPAMYVNWNDATAFCQKLTDLERKAGTLKAGESYHLPTEAQWEYACRAGTTTEYSFGDDEKQLGEYAWFNGNAFDAGEKYAHKVGMKKPNPAGLFDMHGNVLEWCSDWSPAVLPGGSDPAGPRSGSVRVLRGGAWTNSPVYCRSAMTRDGVVPSGRYPILGFRVARSHSNMIVEKRRQGTQAKPAPQVAAAERPVQLGVKSNSIGMELVGIPAGKFTIGEGDGAVDVTLLKPFWLGKTEVTQRQFRKVMGTEPWLDKAVVIGEDNPATCVDWDAATAFCQRLTDTDHKNGKLPADESYRLPTEAEWEYACRAGTTTAFSFGDDVKQLDEYAWFSGNTAVEAYPHAVGLKKPNPWGLHDMHGNVWEWCSEWLSDSVTGGTAGVVWADERVARGGCYQDSDVCRSTSRFFHPTDTTLNDLGFRVARSQSAK